jgi:hypothetical protein
VAELPPGAVRSLHDPYAEKKSPWKSVLVLLLTLLTALAWYVGRLDAYLPGGLKSVKILGVNAPAYKAPPAPTPPVAQPAPSAAAPAPTAPPPASTNATK